MMGVESEANETVQLQAEKVFSFHPSMGVEFCLSEHTCDIYPRSEIKSDPRLDLRSKLRSDPKSVSFNHQIQQNHILEILIGSSVLPIYSEFLRTFVMK